MDIGENIESDPAGSATDRDLTLDAQLCFAVYSAAHAFNKVYRRELKDLDLTYPQYLVMLVLWEKDAVNVSDICERLHLETTTLTPLLKRMEANGLILRQRSQADERQVIVSLTEAGRTLREKARDIPCRLAEAVGCSAEEIGDLRQRLKKLRNTLSR